MSNLPNADGATTADSSVLADLIDGLTAKMQAGERIDWEDAARRHPEHAGELLRLGPALGALGHLSKSGPAELSGLAAPAVAEDGLATGVLGDFRLVREVGRGAMGVVYEAEQMSLGRRVALKVLPFAATMDARALQRFQNEARAAACLHHTNVVPVYYVGCERGIHFYAMQFIDGQTLADLIRELRQPAGQTSIPDERTTAHTPGEEVADPKADTEPAARQSTLTTQNGARSREFFRRAAGWGVQAAEALDHAHQTAIVHRDVKPGNLLLDGRGQLWVADFGLAHVRQGEAGLTMTGDLVGTLRYMSPEQALAKRVPIDHRTDVYSLGATLYELLTLRPALTGKDRQELLRQIAFEEPTPPRRLNKAIPQELEIIVLKAMEKNPVDRYATAQEMADDLRRFLEDKPIRARRPSRRQVAAKWARRHRPAVTAAAVALVAVIAVVGVGVGWALGDRTTRQREAEGKILQALEAAGPGLRQGNPWDHELISAAQRAEAQLGSGVVGPELRQRTEQLQKDVRMLADLERIRLDQARLRDGRFDFTDSDRQYALVFRDYEIDAETLAPEEAASLVQRSAIREQLTAGLDDWALSLTRDGGHKEKVRRLMTVARQADPDPWRNQLREAVATGAVSEQLVRSAPVEELSVATLGLVGRLASDKALGSAEDLLRRAQQLSPADFWINHALADLLCTKVQPRRLEEGIGFYRVAVALRPESPGARVNLGIALAEKGEKDEAIKAFHDALRLQPDYAAAHNNLGAELVDQGRYEEAEKEFREALRLMPDLAYAHQNLGKVLVHKDFFDEAMAEYREAIRIEPNCAAIHFNAGKTLWDMGRLDEAAAEYRKAIRLNPEDAMTHINLSAVLEKKGQLDLAIAEFHQALRLKKDCAEAHTGLGLALAQKGRTDEAVAEFKEAVRIKPNLATTHCDLGTALRNTQQPDEAIREFRRAIELDPKCAKPHCNLGVALHDKGKPDEAIREFRRAIELDPKDAEPHCNLGNELHVKGQVDEAIREYCRAIELDAKYAAPHYNIGCVLDGQGKHEEAEEEFRTALRLKPDDAEAHNNLGNALLRRGKLDEAIGEYRTAIVLNPKEARYHTGLGLTLQVQGKLDESIEEYRAAIVLDPKVAQPHAVLGDALAKQGRFAEARDATQRCLDLLAPGDALRQPVIQQLQQCKQFLVLDQKLAAVLEGKEKPAETERLELAQLCQFKKRYAAATRFYVEAFAAKPALAEKLGEDGGRYDAACVAALAGCGQGNDAASLGEKERAPLRAQALKWLRADLGAWRRLLRTGPDTNRPAVAQQLQHWLEDADLAGVRSEKALLALPEAERPDWQKLWQEVEALRQQAAQHP